MRWMVSPYTEVAFTGAESVRIGVGTVVDFDRVVGTGGETLEQCLGPLAAGFTPVVVEEPGADAPGGEDEGE